MLESDVKRAADRKMADLQTVHRRMREECDHQISLQRDRRIALEAKVKSLQDSLSKSHARLKQVEEEYAGYRESVRKAPEAKLHQEIAKLMGEKAELQVRVEHERAEREAESRAKSVIKAQLFKVAKELQRLQRQDSRRAERALENLRLEYLAREERYVLDGDRNELRSIRADLDHLRRASAASSASPPARARMQPQDGSSYPAGDPQVISAEAARLQQERDALMKTGVYSKDHEVIRQIDRRLRSLSVVEEVA